MRSIKKDSTFWIITFGISFIILSFFTWFILGNVYKNDVEQLKKRGEDILVQMNYMASRVPADSLQKYILDTYAGSETFSYLLVMDTTGRAIAHSDSVRRGMRFYEEGFKEVMRSGKMVEQEYIRDANKPESEYHGERVIDILAPYYTQEGKLGGVVNIGLSLEFVYQMYLKYLLIILFGAIFSLIFIVVALFIRNRYIKLQRQTETKLRKARNYISNIINSMPSELIGIDPEYYVTQWNNEAQRRTLIKPDEAAGKPLSKVYPELTQVLKQATPTFDSKGIKHYHNIVFIEDGEKRYKDITLFPLTDNGIEGAVIRIDDVSDKVRFEEILIQNEKMLSVGGLAAGMAHEINNPLAGMIQTASVLNNRLTDHEMEANIRAAEKHELNIHKLVNYMQERKIPEMTGRIIESGHRAAGIVKNMLSFAGKSPENFSPESINTLMDRAIELASTEYDLKKKYDFRQIIITKNYSEDLPQVHCDAGKIQQVFMNILRNAAEAMHIQKINKNEYAPQLYIKTLHEPLNGVVVEIEDNGPGMTEKVRKRIFEPFFTTKSPENGIGLGLSVSYFIVHENHKGQLNVESSPGKGSLFQVKLPLNNE
jgi:PAS domain S-box-containing protein